MELINYSLIPTNSVDAMIKICDKKIKENFALYKANNQQYYYIECRCFRELKKRLISIKKGMTQTKDVFNNETLKIMVNDGILSRSENLNKKI